ncbi:uncharacterized protein DS421_12g361610 [Arachis hypogaea]|nr:uncharacterized protein DS421_12g361610 [Arachis hypogaea]
MAAPAKSSSRHHRRPDAEPPRKERETSPLLLAPGCRPSRCCRRRVEPFAARERAPRARDAARKRSCRALPLLSHRRARFTVAPRCRPHHHALPSSSKKRRSYVPNRCRLRNWALSPFCRCPGCRGGQETGSCGGWSPRSGCCSCYFLSPFCRPGSTALCFYVFPLLQINSWLLHVAFGIAAVAARVEWTVIVTVEGIGREKTEFVA